MSAEYAIPLTLGVVLYYFADDIVHARRFGPVTDGSRSSDTGGVAFRAAGLLLVGVGLLGLLRTHAPL